MTKPKIIAQLVKYRSIRQYFVLMGAVSALSIPALAFMPSWVNAQQTPGGLRVTLKAADPGEKGTGKLGRAAAEAIARGPLVPRKAAAEAKAAANTAVKKAAASGALKAKPGDLAPVGGAAGAEGASSPAPLAPTVVAGLNTPGLGNPATNTSSPPDTTGAIGTTRYIQLVNSLAGIFNRTTGALIAGGTLNQLAGLNPSVFSFDPQIIWDAQTNRFYYVMVSIFSGTDNRLSFGFSRTASPTNLTTQWCHYTIAFGERFPDYPKLGDSRYFAIIAANNFDGFGPYLGSSVVAISKPPAGTFCPPATSFKSGESSFLVDANGNQVFTPVPSNQIDTWPVGYVITSTFGVPATALWFHNVGRNPANGFPVFGATGRRVNVDPYSVPPNATQPVVGQVLDTLDGRNTQAVQAIDPARGTFSFWTQHTIRSSPGGIASGVRWYELNPVSNPPTVLRDGTIQAEPFFLFNAAISPNRSVNSVQSLFGESFVIEYNVSGAAGIFPRIVAGSSVNGGALQFLLVRNGAGPYIDFTCPFAGTICRWGDYSGATPDPVALVGDNTALIWGTNQFSGVVDPSPSAANWVTRIFAVRP